ncbi:MAG: hypothetical protein IKC87_01605 [Clostridia bacterium]|nr:hypothetical protein [Clostridia bacterium]
MKKLSKILALTLLVAVVLSCFGIFSTFAAEAIATATEYGTVKWNLDNYQKTGYIKVSSGTGNDNDPSLTYNSETGYWEYKYGPNADPTLTGSGGDFWSMDGLGGIYINNKYTGEKTTAEDGTVTDTRNVTTYKNTDYLVYDFDIGSKNGALLEGFYLHVRWYGQSGSSSTSADATQVNYVMFNGSDTESFYVSQYQSSGLHIQPVVTPGEWLNVTIVYDFSSVDEDGYAIPANWKGWVYLDGYLAGQVGAPNAKAVNPYCHRMSTVAGVQDGPDACTLFDNFTVKTFERNYSGPMSESGVLGTTGINLSDIPDLAYTQEDTPYAEDRIIARIDRVGAAMPIDVYHMDDLQASLEDGDVVTLYRSISESIIVGSNDTITFKDTAGTVLTPGTFVDGALVHLAATTKVDFTTGKIVRVRNMNYRSNDGKGTVSAGLTTSVLTDMEVATHNASGVETLYNQVDYTYILLDDYDWNITAAIDMIGDSATFDLNGHKLNLTFNASGKRTFDVGDGNGRIFFKNGDLDADVVAGSDLSMTNATSIFVFDNIGTLGMGAAATFFDQRGGSIIFKDVEDIRIIPHISEDGKKAYVPTLISSKSSGNIRTSVVIDNSNLNFTRADILEGTPEGCKLQTLDNALIIMANISSGGHRRGSMNNFLKVINGSTYNSDCENFVEIDFYANSTGDLVYAEDGTTVIGFDQDEVYAKNDNKVDVVISDSDINTGAWTAIVSRVITFLADKTYKFYPADQFSAVVDIDVNNSVIHSYDTFYQSKSEEAPEGLEYTYDVNVNIDGNSKLDYVRALADRRYSDGFNVTMEDGALLSEIAMNAGEDQTPIVPTLADGSKIAYTSNYDGYNCIVTPTHAPYTYKLGAEGTPVDFLWNVPAEGTDEVDINKVVTLASEAGVYKYSWAQDGNAFSTVLDKDFTLSAQANLTLWSDLYFNLYVPKALADTYAEYISVVDADGALVEGVYVESLDTYKYQIKSLAPTDAKTEVIFLNTHIEGAYAGDVIDLAKGFTIAEYAENVLSNDKTEDDAVIYALLNYLNAMYVLNNGAVDADIDALLPDDYTAATISGEAKLGTLADTTIAINCGTTLNWVITGAANASYEVEYYLAGQLVERTVTADANGVAYINVSTMDMLSSITVNGAEINIQGYYGKLVEMGADANVIAAVEAIYDLATAAVAYNA